MGYRLKGPGLWSPSFKSKVARWAYSYCIAWLTDEQWESFKRRVEMNRAMQSIYGQAIFKQLETGRTLLDKFGK